MNERDQIAHLLRRFGLGAGKYEMARYEPLGYRGAVDKLVDFSGQDDGFPVSPWEVVTQPNGELQLDPSPVMVWWSMGFMATKTPLKEKLALFWHNHFAVSGAKIFDGPSMLAYLQILRMYGAGDFKTLLTGVCASPAMLRYLDVDTSDKAHPNENFGRELLELFTVGAGNYTEKDIKEVSRAFTAWKVHYAGLGDESLYAEIISRWARQGRSVFSFCVVPEQMDNGTKEILGKSGDFKGEQVLELLAQHPATARHLAKKLWEWFAYVNPEPAVVERIAKVLLDSGMQIRPALKAIANSPEFLSERCVRTMGKSPLDFTGAIFRQLGLQDIVMAMRGNPKDAYTPISNELRGASGGLGFLMASQGLLLLFPPNVGGWEWGDAWITSANITQRIKHAYILFVGDDVNRPISAYLAGKISSDKKPVNSQDIVDELLLMFDVNLPKEKQTILVQACDAHGGVAALSDKEKAAHLFESVMGTLFAAPEFQLC